MRGPACLLYLSISVQLNISGSAGPGHALSNTCQPFRNSLISMSRHSIIAAENFAYSFRHINPSNYISSVQKAVS